MTFLSGTRFIDRKKVDEYLLNPDEPKSSFFTALGFEQINSAVLMQALSRHPADNTVVMTVKTGYGTKSIVECNLVTPDGRNPCVRSVWILEDDSDLHRLVTAYPARNK